MKHEIHEKKSKGLVPRLRFPEFRDAGEWKERELGKEATIVMGASPKSEFYNEENIGLPLLQGNTDIKNRVSAPRIFTTQITKECQKGNILLSVRAPVGTVAKSLHHACIGRGIAAIRANKDNSQEFLYQWLFAFEPQWQNISQGGTFEAVNSDDIRQLTIAFPKIPEQKKIADCFSSLDELITAEAQKIDTLKAHKKGLMQQLFPAEGETVPGLRFPEFRDAWTINKLGKLGKFIGGGTPSKAIPEYWQGDIPWISSSDIYEDNIYTISITKFINEKSISESATKIIPTGSVLFVSRVGTGKLAINDKEICTSQDFTNFIPKKIHNYFLGYFFIANKSALTSLDQGTSIKGFSKSDLDDFEVCFPSPFEQQKIAVCLSSLDELITAEAQKLDTLKTHKKGLMQGLFPSADEVGV